MPSPSFEERLDRTSMLVLALACSGGYFLYSARVAMSLAVGGVLSIVNFHWIKQAVDFTVLRGGSGPVGKRVLLKYSARYALIGLTLYATIRFTSLDPVLVLAGLLVYVFAILLEAVIEIGTSLIRDRNGRT